jgi:hypothetical protein
MIGPSGGKPGFYNEDMRFFAALLLIVLGAVRPALGQTPLPFPKPVDPQKPGAQAPVKVEPPVKPGAAAPQKPAPDGAAPTEAALGVPIYPSAEYLSSYDAGRGQRYHLFGTNAPFAQIVEYYRSVLKQRGELVYDEPPIHLFEVGRFREETMAFPPGVAVKDYAWAGGLGYINPRRGAEPARFRTIIQIVAVAPAAAR